MSIRHFLFVKLFVNLLIFVIAVDEKDEVSIKAVSDMIASNFKNIKSIKTDPSYPDGQFKKTANNQKLRSLFPNFKFTPLDEAVRESVEWFVDNCQIQGLVRLGGESK